MNSREKIVPIKIFKEINYGNHKINNFFVKNINKLKYEEDEKINYKEILNPDKRSKVLIFTPNMESESFYSKITEMIKDKELRVYIYSDDKRSRKMIDRTNNNFLIRFGENLAESSFLIWEENRKRKGILFNGDITDLNINITLNLNENQCEILARYFSKCFWNESKLEIRNGKKIKEPESLENIILREFNYSYEDIKDKFNKSLVENNYSLINYNKKLDSSEISESKVLFNKEFSSEIDRIFRENQMFEKDNANDFRINLEEERINFFILDDKGYFISSKSLSKKENKVFTLELDGVQLEEMKKIFEIRFENSDYYYCEKEKVSNISDNYFYRDINIVLKVEESIEKELDSIYCDSFEEFKNFNSDNYFNSKEKFDKDKPSLITNYNFDLHPPYLINGVKDAELVINWNKTKERVKNEKNKLINKLENNLKQLEKTKGYFLFKIFKNKKKSKFEGFLEKLKEIQEELITDLSVSNRESLVDTLKKIGNELLKFDDEFESKKDEDKQENEWKNKKKKLNENKKKYEEELEKSEENFIKKENKIKEKSLEILDNEVKVIQEKNKEMKEKLKEFSNLKNKLENEISAEIIKDLINKIDSKSKKVLEKINENIKSMNTKIVEKSKEIEDLNLRLSKLEIEGESEKDKNNLDKENLNNDIEKYELELQKLKKEVKEKQNELQEKCNYTLEKEVTDINKEIQKVQEELKVFNNLKEFLEKEVTIELIDNLTKKMNRKEKKEFIPIKKEYKKEIEEVERIKKNIEENNREISDLGIEFRYKSISKSGLEKKKNTINNNAFEVTFPSESINRVGNLYEKDKMRFLVIEYQDELELAMKESKRLDAKLCIKKGE